MMMLLPDKYDTCIVAPISILLVFQDCQKQFISIALYFVLLQLTKV